jgi:uncharacterized phage protein (TIGR01671 family)
MREIKFRAWNTIDSEWIDTFTIHNKVQQGSALINGLPTQFNYKSVKIMQFTGLKDKNGVEIYEGDIVKFHWRGFNGSETDNDSIGKVIYEDRGCMFLFKVKSIQSNSGYNTFSVFDTSHYEVDPCIEVIGNIYEDKHLLK